jgi:hypothetical protein
MRLKPKATVHQRQRTGLPDIRVWLAEQAAGRRRRRTPPRETDLMAALIARRRAGRSGKGEDE